MLMEKAVTGGSLFRNLYRDFLQEAQEYIESNALALAYKNYSEIAKSWKEVAELFNEAGETEDVDYINAASKLLVVISKKEQETMGVLLTLS
jgi:hypothetical protein